MDPSLFLYVLYVPLTIGQAGLAAAASCGLFAVRLGAYRLGTMVCNDHTPETRMEKKLQELWASVLNMAAETGIYFSGKERVMGRRIFWNRSVNTRCVS
jgi:hypothetical protein